MKRQVRVGVFETNSSSEHSIAVVPKNDYDRWVSGELVARSLGRKESPDPCGNFWSYIHEIEFAPAGQRDELNTKYINENYFNFADPSNGWRGYKSPDKLLEMYKIGKLNHNMCLYMKYDDFVESGFEGESYVEHFSHNAPNGLKIFGTYYHS